MRLGCACCRERPTHRLRLRDGRYVFMEFHSYTGPYFFRDRQCTRELSEWWDDEALIEALDWFCKRGHKS